MKLLSEKIQYEKYNWNICGDLEVIAILLGYTKVGCLLCEWKSTDRKHLYIQKPRHKNTIVFFQDKKNCKYYILKKKQKMFIFNSTNEST